MKCCSKQTGGESEVEVPLEGCKLNHQIGASRGRGRCSYCKQKPAQRPRFWHGFCDQPVKVDQCLAPSAQTDTRATEEDGNGSSPQPSEQSRQMMTSNFPTRGHSWPDGSPNFAAMGSSPGSACLAAPAEASPGDASAGAAGQGGGALAVVAGAQPGPLTLGAHRKIEMDSDLACKGADTSPHWRTLRANAHHGVPLRETHKPQKVLAGRAIRQA